MTISNDLILALTGAIIALVLAVLWFIRYVVVKILPKIAEDKVKHASALADLELEKQRMSLDQMKINNAALASLLDYRNEATEHRKEMQTRLDGLHLQVQGEEAKRQKMEIEFNARLANLKSELEAEKRRADKLQSKVDELQKRLNLSEAENVELRQQLAAKQTELDEHRRKIADLTKRVEELQAAAPPETEPKP